MNLLEKLIVKKEIVYAMNYLKKAWPGLLISAGLVAGFLSPSVHAYATSHPAQGAAILFVWQQILSHLPSPVAKS